MVRCTCELRTIAPKSAHYTERPTSQPHYEVPVTQNEQFQDAVGHGKASEVRMGVEVEVEVEVEEAVILLCTTLWN